MRCRPLLVTLLRVGYLEDGLGAWIAMQILERVVICAVIHRRKLLMGVIVRSVYTCRLVWVTASSRHLLPVLLALHIRGLSLLLVHMRCFIWRIPTACHLKAFKANLNRLHVTQELIQTVQVKLGLEADFIRNLLDLGQVRIHQTCSL